MYVTDLAAPGTVNTMPGSTLEAFADHGQVTGDTITQHYDEARHILDQLAAVGIDFDDVTAQLKRDGITTFENSWNELSITIATELHHSRNTTRS